MINFRLVRNLWMFLAVAEEQHFGRAAARLGMSQPPLTEHIQALEASLKVKLLDRDRRGTRLTAAGAAILPEIRRLAEHLERVELALREAVRGRHGLFTVGAVTAAITSLLPDLVAQLRERHPLVTVQLKEINSADAVAAVRDGTIDLAITRSESVPQDGIAFLRLQDDCLAVAVLADHALAKKKTVRLKDLASEDLVMFQRYTSPSYFDTIVSACRDAGFSPRIVHEVSSISSQLAFVSCGQGAAIVPGLMRTMAPQGVLVRPLADAAGAVVTSAAWSASRKHPLIDEALAILA